MLRIRILIAPQLLVPFRRHVDVEPTEACPFDPVSVFVAASIVAPQSEYSVRALWTIRQDYGKINGVGHTLPENEPKVVPASSPDIKLSLPMAPLCAQLNPLLEIRRERLSLLN